MPESGTFCMAGHALLGAMGLWSDPTEHFRCSHKFLGFAPKSYPCMQPVCCQPQVAPVASVLDEQTQGLELRISALQKMVSEKDLELLRLRETVSVLEAEKETWISAAKSLKQEHKRQMKSLGHEALQEKVVISDTLPG